MVASGQGDARVSSAMIHNSGKHTYASTSEMPNSEQAALN